MYFTEFDSYEQVMDKATGFHIEVDQADNHTVSSSNMPIEVLPVVIGYMDVCEESRTAFYVWNYQTKVITAVPPHAIKSLRLVIN
jgi:hypothetical protein